MRKRDTSGVWGPENQCLMENFRTVRQELVLLFARECLLQRNCMWVFASGQLHVSGCFRTIGLKKGHESVFCDRVCQEWLHRQCAGLSKIAFQGILTCGNLFYCPHCVITRQSKEISDLRGSVQALSRDFKALKEQLDSTSHNQQTPVSSVVVEEQGDTSPVRTQGPLLSTTSHPPVCSSSSIITLDRKYNVNSKNNNCF